MTTTTKLHPGLDFAPVTFKRLDGPDFTFGGTGKWQALFVFRGQHCPICKRYLATLETKRSAFTELGVEIAAVSADSAEQTRIVAEAAQPGFPLLYGMSEQAMKALGLYISDPRSEKETDHPFPEPGLFVLRPDGCLQIVDVANAPFVRPELDTLLGGLRFVIANDYPVRGTRR
ncbi:MAG: redoxin domain-containing protein [Paracoccaceae bacterium]|nr:redoxin domain-containing protein [Paracoccaceae bacterium]